MLLSDLLLLELCIDRHLSWSLLKIVWGCCRQDGSRGARRMWLPRTGSLCRLLALMVGLLVVFHAASCGYFFCFRFPVSIGHDAYDNIRDLFSLAGGPKVYPPPPPPPPPPAPGWGGVPPNSRRTRVSVGHDVRTTSVTSLLKFRGPR